MITILNIKNRTKRHKYEAKVSRRVGILSDKVKVAWSEGGVDCLDGRRTKDSVYYGAKLRHTKDISLNIC